MSHRINTFPLQAPPFDGNSRAVAAGNAFEWLKQGWAQFVAFPGAWIALTVVLLVIVLGLSIVAGVGVLAAHLLTPLLVAGMLLACEKVSRGESPAIADLFAGLREKSSALLMLGILYMAAMLLIVAIVFVVGGTSLSGLAMGSSLGVGLAFGGIFFALLLSLALSVPLVMAIWFAPALVVFNHMTPRDALKASFTACLKNTLPFLVYGLLVLVLMLFAALPVFLGFLVLLPVIAGSLYASYRDIFVAN